MRRFIVYAVLGCWPISAYALIIHIPADYPTIQQGIDAAANGDTVLVAPGEYEENPVIVDKNILLTSAEGPTNTHISGHASIRGFSVDTTCVLRGFRISMVVEDPYRNSYSLMSVYQGSPIIMGNIIEDNETTQSGAGVLSYVSGAIIRNNIIRNNYTFNRGGGIAAARVDTFFLHRNIIEGNIITGNRAGWSACESGNAGGISAGAAAIVKYNLIVDNETFRYGCQPEGGGMRISATHKTVHNNTIVANSARMGSSDGLGGGMMILGINAREGIFKNNLIAFNTYGGGVYGSISDSADVEWDYNLVFGNGGGDYIGIEPGPHDIQADPMFVDRFSGDYHLLPNSPCIDAGDPDSPLDPDGTRADIGAYYFDQTVGIDDDGQPTGPYQFQLRQNYPNPFNSETIISYYLPESAVVSLHIFAITGHFVKALANKEIQSAGEHEYTWDGTDRNGKEVSTGIYFYELYVDDHRESKPMIMIK